MQTCETRYEADPKEWEKGRTGKLSRKKNLFLACYVERRLVRPAQQSFLGVWICAERQRKFPCV